MDDLQPKAARVKNKAPASVQITAEQILRESRDRQDLWKKPAAQKIADQEELNDFRAKRRQEYENSIRKDRTNPLNWVRYARFEESQFEFERYHLTFLMQLELVLFLKEDWMWTIAPIKYGFATLKWK